MHALQRQAFGGMPVELIVGAEWWVQEQQSHADIGFHYDKDEAFASNQMTMLFPEVPPCAPRDTVLVLLCACSPDSHATGLTITISSHHDGALPRGESTITLPTDH